jgi:hypothetical protein
MSERGSIGRAGAQSTGGPGTAGRPARAERLADALKSNLRRRKTQAQARAAGGDEAATDTPAPAGSHDSARIVDDKQSG